MAASCTSNNASEALAVAYRYEQRLFGIDSVLVEPGIPPSAKMSTRAAILRPSSCSGAGESFRAGCSGRAC